MAAGLLQRVFPPCHPSMRKIACRYRLCEWSKTLPVGPNNEDQTLRALMKAYGAHARQKHGTPQRLQLVKGGRR